MNAGKPAARSGGQLVPSVIRAGAILDTLAAGPPSASLASLSKRLGYPRSSTLALCNSLVEAGLLLRDEDGYRLGPHILELSRAVLAQTDLQSEFRRAVTARPGPLSEQTLVCSVLRGRDVIYVDRRAGASPLGVTYEIGLRLPAHCTAGGLAMLSTLGSGELDELYGDGEPLEQLTPRSISSLADLRARLATVRERGYAVDDGETAPAMICLGAAVRDDADATVGAVAVSMPKGARSEAELSEDADELRGLARTISGALGAP